MAKTPPRSSFFGVTWSKRQKKWQSGISLQGRYLYLGAFCCEEDAAYAWDLAALKVRGKTTRTNFAVMQYLDSKGHLIEHQRIDAALSNHRARRAAEEAAVRKERALDAATAAVLVPACAGGAAADSAVAAAPAAAYGPTKRRKRSRTDCEVPYHDEVGGNARLTCSRAGDDAVGWGLSCIADTGSATTTPAAADMNYSNDVWSELEKCSMPRPSDDAAWGTETGSPASSQIMCIPQPHGAALDQATSFMDYRCNHCTPPQQLLKSAALFPCGPQQQRYGHTLQQHQNQIASTGAGKAVAVINMLPSQPLQMPRPLQQQGGNRYHLAAPYLGMHSLAPTAGDALTPTSDSTSEDDLLPPLTALMQSENLHMSLHSMHTNSNSSSLPQLDQLQAQNPGYQLVNVLLRDAMMLGAVLVAEYPRPGGVQVMPWRAWVWGRCGWQQLGSFADQAEATQACDNVLGLMTGR